MRNPSVSSCADACTCSPLCLCVPADVAANLTISAIIVQRALWQGVGEKGIPVRGRCGPSVERGPSSSFHQPPRPRHGLGRVQQLGRTASGGCRRRSHSVHSAQLAMDTTLVSPLRRDGSPRPRAADHSGAALDEEQLSRIVWRRGKFSLYGPGC